MTPTPSPLATEVARYRKKPVVVWAMQFRGPKDILIGGVDYAVAFDDWLVANQGPRPCRYVGSALVIQTPEGDMRADPGDWIIVGTKGELYPCKPDIFAATYEPAVARYRERAARKASLALEPRLARCISWFCKRLRNRGLHD